MKDRKVSARNIFNVKVKNIEKGDNLALVTLKTKEKIKIRALIDSEAFKTFILEKGQKVKVVFKATEVLLQS